MDGVVTSHKTNNRYYVLSKYALLLRYLLVYTFSFDLFWIVERAPFILSWKALRNVYVLDVRIPFHTQEASVTYSITCSTVVVGALTAVDATEKGKKK